MIYWGKQTDEMRDYVLNAKRSRSLTWTLYALVAMLVLSAAVLGWTIFDQNVDRSRWIQRDGSYYHLDFHGKKQSGWQKVDGSVYYFFPDTKKMATDLQQIDGNTYYFSGDGTLDTGWQDIGGQRWWFGSDGIRRTGWVDAAGSRCYVDPQTGMATGWLTLEDGTYYLAPSGSMTVEWAEIDGSRYYFDQDGRMVTGDVILEDRSYRFDDQGRLFTGWAGEDGARIYYTEDGPAATGWTDIDGARYYFDQDHRMVTGWLEEGEYRYYLQEDGTAAVGPTQIDGQTCYFTPKGVHILLVNAKNKLPAGYQVELVTVETWNKVDVACYDALAQMLADCNAAGISYTFNSAYRTQGQQAQILSQRTQEYEDQGMSHSAAYWKARQTVALPGTSEHQLGLAVDLLGDEAIAWLTEHCWDYGFIVRYLEGKSDWTGIIHEPWHFRYVGREVAQELRENGLCLEEYLGAEPVNG